MTISLEQVKEIFPEHLCLEISKSSREQARAVADRYADLVVRDRVFLNSLCLDIILPTITDIFDVQESSVDSKKIKQEHEKVWQSLNGVAIDLPQARLVLIPTEDFDTEELRLKQKWLNDPELMGDFYLAVQVSLEDSWLRVWGFTSHKELKEQVNYDISDSSYAIDRSDLWMTLEAIPVLENLINLKRQIKKNILKELDFSSIWQPFDEFVAAWNWQPAMEFRQNRFQRHWARKIDQSITLQDHPYALMIGFEEEADHKYLIQVRISSGNEQIYLPDNLELILLEANGEVIDTSISRQADNWIQVQFTGEVDDEFQVKVQRAEVSIIEEFVI